MDVSVPDIGGWRPGERPRSSVKRAVVEQIERAIRAAEDESLPHDVAIHTARKAVKRSRGLLRLLRDALGPGFTEHNIALRDINRVLAGPRDATVVAHAFDDRVTDLASILGSEALARIRACVVGANESPGRVSRVRLHAVSPLRAARSRFQGLSFDPSEAGWVTLAGGLRRVYATGRKAMSHAVVSGRAESFHEWRKHVKYLRYQLEHLRALEPDEVGSLVDRLRSVDVSLGDAHDVWLLAGRFAGCLPRSDRMAAVEALIGAEQLLLEGKALQMGRRPYADDPAHFVGRFDDYWETAAAG